MNKPFLICHRGALGDFILTWPALSGLRRVLPDCPFIGIGRREYMHLARDRGLLDYYLDMEAASMVDFFSGHALPPDCGPPAGAVLWLSHGRKTAELIKQHAFLPVVLIPPFPSHSMHVAAYYCRTVQTGFPIAIPSDLSDCFDDRIGAGDYALIHPGSGSPEKNYPPQLYREAAGILRKSGFAKVGFLLGPVERELGAEAVFAGEWLVQPENIKELATVLAEAALLVGNDSGVSHLAGALGVPTIALYKNTDPEIWGVIGKRVANLRAENEKIAARKIRECVRRWQGQ